MTKAIDWFCWTLQKKKNLPPTPPTHPISLASCTDSPSETDSFRSIRSAAPGRVFYPPPPPPPVPHSAHSGFTWKFIDFSAHSSSLNFVRFNCLNSSHREARARCIFMRPAVGDSALYRSANNKKEINEILFLWPRGGAFLFFAIDLNLKNKYTTRGRIYRMKLTWPANPTPIGVALCVDKWTRSKWIINFLLFSLSLSLSLFCSLGHFHFCASTHTFWIKQDASPPKPPNPTPQPPPRHRFIAAD